MNTFTSHKEGTMLNDVGHGGNDCALSPWLGVKYAKEMLLFQSDYFVNYKVAFFNPKFSV